MMFDSHCSDGQLLAHADGENLWWREMRVSWHLRRCWFCRGRLQALEWQAHAISKMVLTPDGRWPVRIAEARAEFRDRQRQEERIVRNSGIASSLSLPARVKWKITVPVTVSAVLCLVIAGTYWARRNALPPAAEIVEKCEVEQRAVESSSAHQVFAVEVKQTRPVRLERKGRLEVWSETGSRRFASRWTASTGVLVHALWRPSVGQEYVLDPESATEPQRRGPRVKHAFALSELARTGLDPRSVETEFLRWLENRDWRPVGLKSGLIQYVSEDGALLRAARCGTVLCLSATRSEAGITAEVVVEVDPVSFRPRLQTIRLESAERRVEFSLRLERLETSVQATLLPAVFEPNTAGLRLPDSALRRRGTITSAEQFSGSSSAGDTLPRDSAWLEARTLELYYALHRAHACLGEPVEVVQYASGHLTVRGLVGTLERKQQILDALSELGDPSWLKLEIRTVAELPKSAINRTREYAAQGQVEMTTGVVEMSAPAGQLPSLAALGLYFERQTGGGRTLTREQRDEVGRRIAHFSNQAVSHADSLLREAWALRRLAERYPSISGLSPQSRWLLQRIVDDHLTSLRTQVEATRSLLVPIWEEDSGAVVADSDDWSVLGWNETVLRAFGKADQLHRAISALFLGAAGNAEDVAKPGRLTASGSESPDESVGQLVNRLASFEKAIGIAQEAVQERFSGKTSSAVLNR